MKRAAILLTLGLAAGCANQGQDSPKAPELQPPPAVQYPSHGSEPAGQYYETNRDGKTYVTAYVDTANMIRSGQVPPYMVEKSNFGPDSKTVYFESDGNGLEKRLEKDYLSQHKK